MNRARTLALLLLVLTLAPLLGACAAPARGVVAADHPLASKAGADILRRGGNAIDAAVATSLALSVVRPDSCGIGGGGFMVIHFNDHPVFQDRSTAINYRETCPAAIGPDTYAEWNDPDASRFGARAVGVPGTIAGLLHAHERYGRLPRADVFAPAIRLAEQGFPADRHHVDTARELAPRFAERPEWQLRFPWVWERMLRRGSIKVGDTIQNPNQAEALRLIARDGRAAFYEGPIADAIVRAVQADGGVITHEDLAAYRPRESDPLRTETAHGVLLTMPPPSSGGIAIAQFFALTERVGARFPPDGWPDPQDAHLAAEAFKHAFADRARFLADPAFVDVPVERMLDPDQLDRMAAAIQPARTLNPQAYGLTEPLPTDAGTSHISVVDRDGHAVACTETINLAFGSLLAVPEFGFCLNNEMDDFTTIRGRANAFGLRQSDENLPEPGKRPLSSMSPTIAIDREGNVLAVAGASGGPRIITSTAQVLHRVLVSGATAEEAVGAPRIHHQWLPETLFLEARASDPPPSTLLEALNARGHALGEMNGIGAVQLIRRAPDGTNWQAASDPRKGGRPAYE